jgi:hypothetical protein
MRRRTTDATHGRRRDTGGGPASRGDRLEASRRGRGPQQKEGSGGDTTTQEASKQEKGEGDRRRGYKEEGWRYYNRLPTLSILVVLI